MAKTAIIVLAEGFEEIEAVTPADVLRRAGVEVELVGLDAETVTGAHGITFEADRVLGEFEEVDAIILPGGLPGAENLAASVKLASVLHAQADSGKLVAAICASPACVLAAHGLLDDRHATCYPGFEDRFDEFAFFWEGDVRVRLGLGEEAQCLVVTEPWILHTQGPIARHKHLFRKQRRPLGDFHHVSHSQEQ